MDQYVNNSMEVLNYKTLFYDIYLSAIGTSKNKKIHSFISILKQTDWEI